MEFHKRIECVIAVISCVGAKWRKKEFITILNQLSVFGFRIYIFSCALCASIYTHTLYMLHTHDFFFSFSLLILFVVVHSIESCVFVCLCSLFSWTYFMAIVKANFIVLCTITTIIVREFCFK